jgi:hypothetical protein
MSPRDEAEAYRTRPGYWVSIKLNSRKSTVGGAHPGSDRESSSYCCPRTSYVVAAIMQLITFGPRTIPDSVRVATINAIGFFIADLFISAERREDFVARFEDFVGDELKRR